MSSSERVEEVTERTGGFLVALLFILVVLCCT